MPIGVSLEQNPSSAFQRAILDILSAIVPVRYDDAGIALFQEASRAVWDTMSPADRDHLADESARRVVELFGKAESDPA